MARIRRILCDTARHLFPHLPVRFVIPVHALRPWVYLQHINLNRIRVTHGVNLNFG